jgi:hypothetical protein
MTRPIDELNSRFEYTSDKFDKWTIMSQEEGKLKGDCEDYAFSFGMNVTNHISKCF